MAIHYLISLSSKSLQLCCCYLARTVTHRAESLTLPQPGKGIKSISRVFEVYYPKRNMTAQMRAQDHHAGEPFAQVSADTGKQGLISPALQLHSPASVLYKTIPPPPLPSHASTLTHRLVPVLHACLQLRASGTCRNIGTRALTNMSA